MSGKLVDCSLKIAFIVPIDAFGRVMDHGESNLTGQVRGWPVSNGLLWHRTQQPHTMQGGVSRQRLPLLLRRRSIRKKIQHHLRGGIGLRNDKDVGGGVCAGVDEADDHQGRVG